jgi:hypothetical protein
MTHPADAFPRLYAEFRDAYVSTMLWSSNDESDESGGEPLDRNYSESDLAPEALAAIETDCRAFFAAHSDLFSNDHCLNYGPDFGIEGHAGHDFWLTRNGHGAGFWDGDWTEPAATILDNAAQAFGTVDPYVGDDGRIYL